MACTFLFLFTVALRTIKRSNQMRQSLLVYRVLAYCPMGSECPCGSHYSPLKQIGIRGSLSSTPETLITARKSGHRFQNLIIVVLSSTENMNNFITIGNCKANLDFFLNTYQSSNAPKILFLYISKSYVCKGFRAYILGSESLATSYRGPIHNHFTQHVHWCPLQLFHVCFLYYKISRGPARTKIHLSDQIDFACYFPVLLACY